MPHGLSASGIELRSHAARPAARPLPYFLLIAFACLPRVGVASQPEVPPKLAPWADVAYPERIFLQVQAPGEAGNVDLHRDISAAGLRLSLRMVPPSGGQLGALAPEQILLMGEDGIPQPVNLRQTPGDPDIEIRFRTQPGLRRFCLYYGAPLNGHQRVSTTDFVPSDFGLTMRGRSSPGDFQVSTDKPLTLERFQAMEKSAANALGPRMPATIDEPECPYVNVTVDGLGHNPQILDPERYAALYEGFLRTPMRGSYAFALDTPGVAHVQIDGITLLTTDVPDSDRAPFALQKSVELNEGVHRVVVYYAEANPVGKNNSSLQRFGLRLHWKPPWEQALMCIPPDAFLHALPVQIVRHEIASGPAQGAKDGGGAAMPFIQAEILGHVRCAAHLGDLGAREQVLLFLRAIDTDKEVCWSISAGKKVSVCEPLKPEGLLKWLPAGVDIAVELDSTLDPSKKMGPIAQRTLHLPTGKEGRPGVLDLEGELALKNAPDFLYGDETAHIHVQTSVCLPPRILTKERGEAKLRFAPARPMGEFRLNWTIRNDKGTPSLEGGDVDVTPLENGCLHRVSLPGSQLDPLSRDGHSQILLTLRVGGVECESIRLRLLHASKEWPGEVLAGPGNLFYAPESVDALAGSRVAHAPSDALHDKFGVSVPAWELDRVLMLLTRQSDADYRNFTPLRSAVSGGLGDSALFLGDPLVESVPANVPQGRVYGIANSLATSFTNFKWEQVYVAGPHRNLPVYRLIAELEKYLRAHNKIPALVVLSLGAGDAARQTPLYSFERALDALLDRMTEFGAKKIVLVGVVPEVDRKDHAEPYQQKVLDLQRQHHLNGVDIFHAWTKEDKWSRRYAVDKEESVFGPLPNAEALEEIAKMIEEQIR